MRRVLTAVLLGAMTTPAGANDFMYADAPRGVFVTAPRGVDLHASAGEELVRYSPGLIIGGAAAEQDITQTIGKESISIPAGTVMEQVVTSSALKVCHNLGKTQLGCALDDDGDGTFDRVSRFQGRKAVPIAQPVKYQRVADVRIKVGDALWTDPLRGLESALLYQGSDGKTIRLSYREFIDGIARDAFSEELTLPLGASMPTQIAAKGFVFTIKEINGLGMRFTIDKIP